MRSTPHEVRRARELSDIKFRFTSSSEPDPSNVNSKAVIVLTYANWEGFYNECARAYIRVLQECGGKIRDTRLDDARRRP